MKFLVEPIWPWPLVVMTSLALFALVWWLYPTRIRHLPKGQRRLLLGLRIAAVVLLTLAMFRPSVELQETDESPAQLIVLGDASRSMQTPDGPGGITRREALLNTLAESIDDIEALEDDVQIRFLDFAANLEPVEAFEDRAEGMQTALGNVLDNLLRDLTGEKLVGVILISDGAQRALPPRDADPRMVARRYGERQIPIYTVALGESGLAETTLDVAVEDLVVDPVVFEKKTVYLNARIRLLGAAGRKVQVRLLVEDRSGKNSGEVGELVQPPNTRETISGIEVETNKSSDLIPVELSYIPQIPGEFKVAVEAVPLDEESQVTNNRLETIISVQKGGLRVLYVDRLRPESSFIRRRVQRSEKIQFDVVNTRSGKFADRNEFTEDMFAPGSYDAYLIGDVAASVFGPERLAQLYRCVENGAGLMMTGGSHNYGAGGYRQTQLAEALPVVLRPQGVDPSLTQVTEELQMLPTAVGVRRFVMRLDSDPAVTQSIWRSLPKLAGANRLEVKPGVAEVLAESAEGGLPLLIAQEFGRARVLAFAADTTWMWALGDEAQQLAHERFWTQVILWLSHKDVDGDSAVWVRVDPRNYQPGQTAQLEFGARDEEGAPIENVEFEVDVYGPEESRTGLAPVAGSEAYTADFSQTTVPGDYWAQVRAFQDNRPIGSAWTRFLVDQRDLELDNPAADPELLDEIAMFSGGAILDPEQLPRRFGQWREQGIPNLDVERIEEINLWDNWPFLIAFVGVLSAEWFLRKRRGLV